MNPRYKYELDGNLFTEPMGWDGWKTSLNRNQGVGGIVEEQSGQVTFSGDGYAYLFEKRKLGYCNSVEVRIWEDCSRSGDFKLGFEGKIFLSDAEFDITDCMVKCDLIDNSYFAMIANNRSIEVSVNAGKSKNGFDIAALDMWDIQMFNPCDGVDSGLPKPKSYRLFDVGDYILQFMSDGAIRLESSILDLSGEFEGVFLSSSILMVDPATNNTGIIFTWEKWIENVRSLCAISWRMVKRPSGIVMLIEKTTDTFVNTVSVNLPAVKKIVRKIDSTRNYAAVELGSDDVVDSLGCGVLGGGEPAFPDQINLLGCKREQFTVVGTCNDNSILSLIIDWVISSNVIEEIYFNGDEGYSEKVIVIDCVSLNSSTLTAAATKGDVFGTTPPVFYNTRFYNYEVIKRHLRGIPNTLVKYLTIPDTGFKAKYTATETITFPPTIVSGATITFFPFPFGDDFTSPNFDLNNDYGNGTTPGNLVTQVNSRYDAPADNVYKFRTTMDLLTSSTIYDITVTYERYDSALTLLATYPVNRTFTGGNYYGEMFDSPLIYMNATDVMAVRITWEFVGPSVGATFELLATGTQGGTFEVYNPEDYIADQLIFDCPMSFAEFKEIQSKITEKISADDGKNQVSGWIDDLTFDRHRNMAEITLITNGR
jgi:hypothetical protein